MRNPFKRNTERPTGGSGLLGSGSRGRGAYTVEIPDIGAGHYLYDPKASCEVHQRRLEAWCDIEDFETAREELHWHCMMLSQLGTSEEDIREISDGLIESRAERMAAKEELKLEQGMAEAEGNLNSAPVRVQAQREAQQQAEEREKELYEEADAGDEKVDALRAKFNSLPRRERVPIRFRLVVGVSVSFMIFDVGVLGNAFELLPGDTIWKLILTFGVALAPLSIAIGIAQWISAAELPLREGVKATWFAIAAGAVAIIGIGLIVLFRAAASGEPPLPFKAYLFLAFIQSALGMAEAMLYVVYFDSKVGNALLDRIKAAEKDVGEIEKLALGEHQRGRNAQEAIGKIEIEAKKCASKVQREPGQSEKRRRAERGGAGMLKGIVGLAILEGVAARKRAEERKRAELEERERQRAEREAGVHPRPDLRGWVTGATTIAVIALIVGVAGVM